MRSRVMCLVASVSIITVTVVSCSAVYSMPLHNVVIYDCSVYGNIPMQLYRSAHRVYFCGTAI